MSSSQVQKVNFFFENVTTTINRRKELKKFIEFIFKNENRPLYSINYIFCNDKKILQINKDYLRHNYYTDIITFEYSEAKEPVISDVYISIDRVKSNAVAHGTHLKQELSRVIFHGALHLCGYRDKTSRQRREMRNLEDFYLSKFFS